MCKPAVCNTQHTFHPQRNHTSTSSERRDEKDLFSKENLRLAQQQENSYLCCMEDKRNEQRKEWINNHPDVSKKPSMLRRMSGHDYQAPCIYMITLVVKNRKPILGRLCYPNNTVTTPSIELTKLGKRVRDEWYNIRIHHPEIQQYTLQIMPDHIHGILHVKERIPIHLGKIIGFFKKTCNKFQLTEMWEDGYHDRILLREGQLKSMIQYIKDNPKRLWIKKTHPQLFNVLHDFTINGQTVQAMGNIFLLDFPYKQQVQCSRKMTDTEITLMKKKLLDFTPRDTVLVSPCISKGEKEIMKSGFEEGFPQIILLENGFAKHQKPQGRQFDACAEGRLLLIAPWPHHNEQKTISREQCLQLNELARIISQK